VNFGPPALPVYEQPICPSDGYLSCGRTPVPRTSLTACGTARLRHLAQTPVPSRLGRLFQTAFRRARTCAALSRRLHSSRRHFQQQVGCSLRGQRNLPLARLRPRQPEAAHDSPGRRVPASLPAPPAATRLHAHSQLRLPRQPAASHPPAAVFPTALWLGKHARSGAIAFHGPASLALELSGLRRNYARRRTALCRATLAPLSTSVRPVRSMNLDPHPRLLSVLRHPRRVLVSSGEPCPVSQLRSLCPPPQRNATPLDPVPPTVSPTHRSGFLNTLDPIGSIQIP
jgi:hypothetical protein